jgi:predicted 3-demethylubiquinone-9 3-methyltransferase (glyoxalase superfamily)
MQKIVPNLWFDTQAEEAANFYVSVFKDGRVISRLDYPANSDKAGEAVTVEWEVQGMRFVGINGGPEFTFSEAVSFQITCEDQDEIDYYWDRLTADGGEEAPCGWCKDKYGLSWQVVPKGMDDLFNDPDKSKVERAWAAMMKMRKLDVAALREAAEGVPAA